MYFLLNIGIIIGAGIVLGTLHKLTMKLFELQKLSYLASYRLIWFNLFLTFMTITVCITLMALHVAVWLGVIVGIIVFIGMFFDPNRPLSADVKRSLEIARSRRYE